jgi:hypothetical protein
VLVLVLVVLVVLLLVLLQLLLMLLLLLSVLGRQSLAPSTCRATAAHRKPMPKV